MNVMTERNSLGAQGTATRSAFVAYAPATDWGVATLKALKIARGYFDRRPKSLAKAIGSCHSESYLNMQFIGDKPMHLPTFVRLLTSIPRDVARAALQAIAAPLGLCVSFDDASPVKDIKSEMCEAAAACGRVFDRVQQAIADGRVTDVERAEIDRCVATAKANLSDVEKALGA